MNNKPDKDDVSHGKVGLMVFGDTRAGKTVYLAALYALNANNKDLDATLRPAGTADEIDYLNQLVTELKCGQWPDGTIATQRVHLVVDHHRKPREVMFIDYRGGQVRDVMDATTGEGVNSEGDAVTAFRKASSYIFLIDAESLYRAHMTLEQIKKSDTPATEEQKAIVEEAERRMKYPVRALEYLRKRSGRSMIHHPVGIVFTKRDAVPEIAGPDFDAKAFAEKNIPELCSYVERYTKKSHAFFAITCVDSHGNDDSAPECSGPNLEQVEANELLKPLLWAMEADSSRKKQLKRFAAVVVAVVIVVATGFLWRDYIQTRNRINIDSSTMDRDGLGVIYKKPSRAEGGIWTDFIPIRRIATEEARKRIEGELDPYLVKGTLKPATVQGFNTTQRIIGEYGQLFPNTPFVKRWEKSLEVAGLELGESLGIKLKAAYDRDENIAIIAIQAEIDKLPLRYRPREID